MKTTKQSKSVWTATFLIIILPVLILAQSTSPEVISSSGKYFSNSSGSMSWTLGETVTKTFSNGSNILTQGFQQPVFISITGIDLDVFVYLEGPFGYDDMNTDLADLDILPLSQPYNTPPWNYGGAESVASIPYDVVDWVLVELRDATDAASATPSTIIATQAAFLLSDGSVVGLDGFSNLSFNHSVIQSLFVVVWHRNHLGIMSANALTQTGGIYTYDFRTDNKANNQAYGANAQKFLGNGIYGMIGGDANRDGIVNGNDKTEVWNIEAGRHGYLSSDNNMDGQANNLDKNDIWFPNIGEESQIPASYLEVTNPVTGRTWMDRNLGASQVATSSADAAAYGDLYQWGRATEGHESRTSGTTSTNANTAVQNGGNSWDALFITENTSPYDWLSPQDNTLWQGENGINNPCPAGFRLPTEAEWDAERLSWSSNDAAGAFSSPLKLVVGGYRSRSSGLLANAGSNGDYWSSSISSNYARVLGFGSSDALIFSSGRASGFSVRCIKD